jgi:ArsR family metal-binding transcriptional regulator
VLQSNCGRCGSSAQLCSVFAIALLPRIARSSIGQGESLELCK